MIVAIYELLIENDGLVIFQEKPREPLGISRGESRIDISKCLLSAYGSRTGR